MLLKTVNKLFTPGNIYGAHYLSNIDKFVEQIPKNFSDSYTSLEEGDVPSAMRNFGEGAFNTWAALPAYRLGKGMFNSVAKT